MHLRYVLASFGATWVLDMSKAQFGSGNIFGPRTAKIRGQTREFFGVIACINPLTAQIGQATGQININRRVGIHARGVIDQNRCVFFATQAGWGSG